MQGWILSDFSLVSSAKAFDSGFSSDEHSFEGLQAVVRTQQDRAPPRRRDPRGRRGNARVPRDGATARGQPGGAGEQGRRTRGILTAAPNFQTWI